MMKLDIASYCGREIACGCGKKHFCAIRDVTVKRGALAELPRLTAGYKKVFVVADNNTFPICGERVLALTKAAGYHVFEREGHLVPDEDAVAELKAALPEGVDLLLGIGSGVINDTCKYVAWDLDIDSAIVGTAPSMDGYASSGAAMITAGMKVTYTRKPPVFIVGDVDILKNAPLDMIRAGYGDIVGKYSSLCDWRLAALMNGEYFCKPTYDLVMAVTDEIRDSAERIVARENDAIELLMNALVLIGITLSLVGSTRPGSGSEHHLSHFFEIVGLVRNEPHFVHGTDVAYSFVVTAAMREKIRAMERPAFHTEGREAREDAWHRIYGPIYEEIASLQREAGFYDRDMREDYVRKWPEIVEILNECPTAEECRAMLVRAGYDLDDFERMYGAEKIRDAMLYAKDLKNRYSVLWLYYLLFSGE